MAAGFAAEKQCDLQDMVLNIPRLLEFVGRNMGAKPHILGEHTPCVSTLTVLADTSITASHECCHPIKIDLESYNRPTVQAM